MNEMTITFSRPALTINGQRYEVLRTDAQIIQDMLEQDARFEKAKSENLGAALHNKAEALCQYLDKLLGDGARARIAASIEGLPEGSTLGIAASVKLCEQIIADAGRAYAQAFQIKYGDEQPEA